MDTLPASTTLDGRRVGLNRHWRSSRKLLTRYFAAMSFATTCFAKLFEMACQPWRCCSSGYVVSASNVTRTATPLVPGATSTTPVQSPKNLIRASLSNAFKGGMPRMGGSDAGDCRRIIAQITPASLASDRKYLPLAYEKAGSRQRISSIDPADRSSPRSRPGIDASTPDRFLPSRPSAVIGLRPLLGSDTVPGHASPHQFPHVSLDPAMI